MFGFDLIFAAIIEAFFAALTAFFQGFAEFLPDLFGGVV